MSFPLPNPLTPAIAMLRFIGECAEFIGYCAEQSAITLEDWQEQELELASTFPEAWLGEVR